MYVLIADNHQFKAINKAHLIKHTFKKKIHFIIYFSVLQVKEKTQQNNFNVFRT